MHPNLEPFTDLNEALARLIPFHLLQNSQGTVPQEIENNKSEEILDKYSQILDKYSHLMKEMQSDIIYSGQKKVYNILSPAPDRLSARVQAKMSHNLQNLPNGL